MYGKVFESMYEGTLYGQWEAIVTMQQFIVLATADGVVDMTPMAIAARTSLPREIIDKGIETLSSPDPYSRTPGNDGKRISLIDDHKPWGWYIVNHEKYTKMVRREDKREADRLRIANKRNQLNPNDVALCRIPSQPVANVAHEDEDENENKKIRAAKRVPTKWSPSDGCFDFAIKSGMTQKITLEQLDAFRDHEYPKAKKDWDACWRTWCRNWKKWNPGEVVPEHKGYRKPDIQTPEEKRVSDKKAEENLARLQRKAAEATK